MFWLTIIRVSSIYWVCWVWTRVKWCVVIVGYEWIMIMIVWCLFDWVIVLIVYYVVIIVQDYILNCYVDSFFLADYDHHYCYSTSASVINTTSPTSYSNLPTMYSTP